MEIDTAVLWEWDEDTPDGSTGSGRLSIVGRKRPLASRATSPDRAARRDRATADADSQDDRRDALVRLFKEAPPRFEDIPEPNAGREVARPIEGRAVVTTDR